MRTIITLVLFLCICSPFFGEESENRPYLIVLYGARGSGRTITAVRLQQEFSFPTISIAVLLTNQLLEETSLGKKARDFEQTGGVFPEELCLSIVNDRLLRPDCLQGVLLEEFPNTVDQTKALYDQLKSNFTFLAIVIDIPDEWFIKRVENRLVCRMCGRVYDKLSPPSQKGMCDICSGPLEQRLEDSAEFIRSRLETYKTKISPVLDFYREKQLLITISGERKLEELYQEMVSIIESRTGLIGQKSRKKNKLFLQENS